MVVPSSFCLEQPILFPAEEEFEEATGNGLESLLEELLKGSLKVQDASQVLLKALLDS
jgi:hypothetical protein